VVLIGGEKRMKALFMVGMILICSIGQAADRPIRQPAVSGTFYPSDPKDLRRMVEGMLRKAKRVEMSDRLLALITPHAGLIYSGSIAAEAFKQLEDREEIKTVVIVGPSHYVAFDGISVYPKGYYKTPLGLVEIDSDLTEEIVQVDPKTVKFYSPAHRQEHAIEVELPFLQLVLPKAKIVPMVVGLHGARGVDVLKEIFSKLFEHDDVVVVLSVDLSHYHPYGTAVKLDRTALDAICDLDPMSFGEKVDSGQIEIDNPAGVMALLMAARAYGEAEARLLKYANSGDVTGDKSAVVGYGAVMITAKKKTGQSEFNLSEEAKRELLRIARESIRSYLKEGKIPKFKPHHEEIKRSCGAFVTLKKDGRLRGCIGYMEPVMPLYQTVARMAVAAATRDSRFTPVALDELKEIEIEISVLSPMRRIDDPKEVVVGKHGIYIRKGRNSGVLLPQVATEMEWNREQFLKGVCRKAWLPEDAWKEKETELYVFTAEVFSEKEFK
jgi:hypothetical protein